ncbi:unnamed protein product [Microthlaspi erraticum]|uniref:Uncharacterized protein n=1 Tax=Microthlaspi erraticum TaxID=1685480 RepID=A0A6D2K651_9BRAS|nr:unnamed protein product [Microthlaspi erraticum]CAA7049979.1 unnamed protein product [Microthlaspi erraticum]
MSQETARMQVRPTMLRRLYPHRVGIQVNRDWPVGCGPNARWGASQVPQVPSPQEQPKWKMGRPRKHPLHEQEPVVNFRTVWEPVRVAQGPRTLLEYHWDFAFAAE